MAKVYLGRALGVGGFERLVAIKVMHPHLSAEPEFVSMFLDEARLAARIRHPNVVATQDVVQGPEGVLIVMDYVDGPPLSTVLRAVVQAGEQFPIDVVLRIFLDMLAGLHAAHELTGTDGNTLGLVHRDVSPQNVLIGKDGISRLTDFGVAHASARLTTSDGGRLKGKLAYIAPEQTKDGTVDWRADVYSAGVVLWEMLTGRRLFRAENDGGTLRKIMAGEVQPPREIDPTIPEPVEAACLRALAIDRDQRFASAAALGEALEEGARSLGITIATARTVAAFVTAIGAEELEEESRARLASLPPAPGAEPAPSLPPAPALPRELDSGAQPSTIAGSAVTHPPPGRRSKPVLLVVAAVVAVVVIVGLLLRSPASAPPTVAAAPAASASPQPSSASVASATPEAPAASVAPPASAVTASPPVASAPAPRAPRVGSPVAAPKKARPAATNYHPSEL